MTDINFYKTFENKFYAPPEMIKKIRSVYLPFITPLLSLYDTRKTLDIGCGRGEWLELMIENGFEPFGIDLDEGMLETCKTKELPAIQGNAVDYIKTLPSDSYVVVSAFHVVEHLTFEDLISIVAESMRILKPAGLLILETPNSENIRVGTSYFYHDPTHIKPIPMLTLSFLTEYYGFIRNKILRLQESEQLRESKSVSLYDVYCGASQDYAVVAQKTALKDDLSVFDEIFAKKFGLSLESLCERFEERLSAKFSSIEAKAQSAETKAQYAETKAQYAETKAQYAEIKAQNAEIKAQNAEIKAQNAEIKAQNAEIKAQNAKAKAQSAEAALNSIYTSRSWKMTAPYRAVGDLAKKSKRRAKNFLKPHVMGCISLVIRHPKLKKAVLVVLHHIPRFEARLRNFYFGHYVQIISKLSLECITTEECITTDAIDMLPFTCSDEQVYVELKRAIEHKKVGA